MFDVRSMGRDTLEPARRCRVSGCHDARAERMPCQASGSLCRMLGDRPWRGGRLHKPVPRYRYRPHRPAMAWPLRNHRRRRRVGQRRSEWRRRSVGSHLLDRWVWLIQPHFTLRHNLHVAVGVANLYGTGEDRHGLQHPALAGAFTTRVLAVG